jgi:hypothetical protein
MFKPIVIQGAAFTEEQPVISETDVKRVFMVLHGFYGNLFFTKFATGQVENNEDQGIANARKIWAHGLRDYDADTIRAALRATQARHPEFPPSLPQFTALCAANKPRAVFRAAPGLIEMSGALRSVYARDARAINARHTEKKERLANGFKSSVEGLAGLHELIANAVGLAGGNEAAALLNLNRQTPKASA